MIRAEMARREKRCQELMARVEEATERYEKCRPRSKNGVAVEDGPTRADAAQTVFRLL